MQANWNTNEIAAMSEESNLRNLCRQIEQGYVDWSRPATYRGFCISQQWPAIGDLGRYTVNGCRLAFVTSKKRTVRVNTSDGQTIGEFPIQAGLARELYACAGSVLDKS